MTKKIIYAAIAIIVIACIGGYIGAKLVGGNKSTGTLGSTIDATTFTSFALGTDLSHTPLQTVVTNGALTTATATIAYVLNPFGATSTVDFVSIDETAVTSASVAAITYTCGTTTVPGAAPSATLITTGAVATSTTINVVNGVVGGTVTAGGNTRISVNPSEYVACYITTASSTAANAGIAGFYKIRWNR